jgi:flagellar motor switch protein FliN
MSEDNTARELDDETAPDAQETPVDSAMESEDSAAAVSSENNTQGVQPANEPKIDAVRSVVHPELDSRSSPSIGQSADLSMILDIPVTLSMEIGQTRISISELLKLGKDSVIELQRMADEPMDVLVNGTLVAHGEAVVVGDRFGIRLTDVISPQERLRKFT